MFIKVVAIILAICTVELTLLAAQSSADPLFLFVSNNPIVMLARLTLIALLVAVAFRSNFKYRLSYRLSAIGASLLLFIGATGLIIPAVTSGLYDFIRFFDFLLIFQAGLALLLAVMTYESANHKLYVKRSLDRRIPRAVELNKAGQVSTRPAK